MPVTEPINTYQADYNDLCRLGGGNRGGPTLMRVQELLIAAAEPLNEYLEGYVEHNLRRLDDLNPWHVCFVIGITWGHLAADADEFTEAAANLLSDFNDADLRVARRHFLERGPEPIDLTLRSGFRIFQNVLLPNGIPDNLRQLGMAQQRWINQCLGRNRLPYIGSWNSTALFMAALFSDRRLWRTLTDNTVVLPPGGPIFRALHILHEDGVLPDPPAGNEFDTEAFEPAALYINQGLMISLLRGVPRGRSLVDIHSGLYRLGTRRPGE